MTIEALTRPKIEIVAIAEAATDLTTTGHVAGAAAEKVTAAETAVAITDTVNAPETTVTALEPEVTDTPGIGAVAEKVVKAEAASDALNVVAQVTQQEDVLRSGVTSARGSVIWPEIVVAQAAGITDPAELSEEKGGVLHPTER